MRRCYFAKYLNILPYRRDCVGVGQTVKWSATQHDRSNKTFRIFYLAQLNLIRLVLCANKITGCTIPCSNSRHTRDLAFVSQFRILRYCQNQLLHRLPYCILLTLCYRLMRVHIYEDDDIFDRFPQREMMQVKPTILSKYVS